jgi:hypothetical protein
VSKIVCIPSEHAFDEPLDIQFRLFHHPTVDGMGAVGPTLLDDVRRFKISPILRAWDFLSVAIAVGAADEACLRSSSSDGWTREIELVVAVNEVDFWQTQKIEFDSILQFLTGDRWNLRFVPGGLVPEAPKKNRESREDCACLLSGGADSLTGAIDLVAAGRRPLLVSQVAKGDKDQQRIFATRITGPDHHLQLSHKIKVPGLAERSQRGRSLAFIAFGVLGATSLDAYAEEAVIPLYIPENGFISLNIPLTPLRLGSLSTRTTHPYYLGKLQRLLDNAGLRVRLTNPYQLRTKGELLRECQNQDLLRNLVCQSTSCGRFARNGFKHCGRCVPCLVRRSSFLAAGIEDTTEYVFGDLSIGDAKHRNYDDVRSAAFAVQTVRTKGLQQWVGGTLSTTQVGDPTGYLALLTRGINEISAFLTQQRAL